MSLTLLLVNLGKLGLTLRAVKDEIGVKPTKLLPAHLRGELQRHRASILTLLRSESPPLGATQEHLDERLGIAMDLGMLVDVGTPSWLIAMGEALGTAEGARSLAVLELLDTAAERFGAGVVRVLPRFDPVTGEDSFESFRRDSHAANFVLDHDCEEATSAVPLKHASSGPGHPAGNQEERPEPLQDRQGIGSFRGPNLPPDEVQQVGNRRIS